MTQTNIGGVIGSWWNNSPCEIEHGIINWCQNNNTHHVTKRSSQQMLWSSQSVTSSHHMMDSHGNPSTNQVKQASLLRENGKERFDLVFLSGYCGWKSWSCSLSTWLWYCGIFCVWWQDAYVCILLRHAAQLHWWDRWTWVWYPLPRGMANQHCAEGHHWPQPLQLNQ